MLTDQGIPQRSDSKTFGPCLSCKEYSIPKDLFSKAKSECYMIMRKDTFARWRFTDKFTEFFDALQPLANAKMSVITEQHGETKGDGTGPGSGPKSGPGSRTIVVPSATPLKGIVTSISSPSVARQQSLLPGYLPSSLHLPFSHLVAKSPSNSSITAIPTSFKAHNENSAPFA